jgi:serine/threonine protein kinase
MLSTNQVLNQGRYRIIQNVGPSDTSGLYQAYDTVSDTNVVIKERQGSITNSASPAQTEAVKAAFANKGKAMTALEHESLLNVRDYFSDLDGQYLVIESVDGQDLAEILSSGKNSPAVSQVIAWANELLGALDYLHTRRPAVLHGDIKPENVRLTGNSRIKLLSPGIARDGAEAFGDDTAGMPYRSLEQLWETLDAASRKVIANSFDEDSEEVLRSEPDERADIYSLAATLYHAVAGGAPADALARTIEMLDGNADPLRPLHEVNRDVSEELSGVLMRALEIKRENRFASAAEMLKALKAVAPSPSAAQNFADEQAERQRQIDTESKNAPKQKAQKKNTAAAEKDDLLELPVGKTAAVTVASDGADLLGEVVVEKAVTSKTAASASTDFDSMFGDQAPSSGMGKMPLMIGAAAVLLVLIVGGWLLLGSSTTTQQAAPQSSPSADLPKAEAPSQQQAAPAVAAQEPVAQVTSEPAASEHSQKNDEQKAKTKKDEKPQAKPSATPKKAVTVDDIINDN